ncbi:MAG TPA: hypothetical protein VIH57_01830 [Bacteroidales bacterium]
MELDNTLQIPSECLQKQYFDAFIAVSAFESRSSFLAEKINTATISDKIVLAYNEFSDCLYRSVNDKKFKDLDFSFFNVPSKDVSQLPHILNRIFLKNNKKSLDILIDYSSMTKVWYNSILSYFSELEDSYSEVNLWFCYSPSDFTKANPNVTKKVFDTNLPQNSTNKPLALILGLGFENGRSEELARQLNAQITFAFYADPAYDERYVHEVLRNNEALLNKMSHDKIIKYPIYDLNSINESLTQFCINLRLSHQLVLAPIGPKPFTLMCFILSTRYPDIKLWKVSTGGNIAVNDRKPYGELLLYKVMFTSEEVDY